MITKIYFNEGDLQVCWEDSSCGNAMIFWLSRSFFPMEQMNLWAQVGKWIFIGLTSSDSLPSLPSSLIYSSFGLLQVKIEFIELSSHVTRHSFVLSFCLKKIKELKIALVSIEFIIQIVQIDYLSYLICRYTNRSTDKFFFFTIVELIIVSLTKWIFFVFSS